MRSKTAKKKAALLKAFQASPGNISHACELAGISRQTYYYWYDKDAQFRMNVDEISDNSVQILQSSEKNKQHILLALSRHNCDLNKALMEVGLSYSMYRRYLKDDDEFSDKVEWLNDYVKERLLDKAMRKLDEKLEEGEMSAIKLTIEKMGEVRGIVEKKRQEIILPSWAGDNNSDLEGI